MAAGKRPGAIASLGLGGAPAKAANVAAIPAQAPAPSARVRFAAPPAAGPDTASYTLRWHQDDAAEADELRAKLRKDTGRRALDQSAVIRALLKLAIDDDGVRAALVGELTTSGAHDVTAVSS